VYTSVVIRDEAASGGTFRAAFPPLATEIEIEIDEHAIIDSRSSTGIANAAVGQSRARTTRSRTSSVESAAPSALKGS
jgi:hypothetical protein